MTLRVGLVINPIAGIGGPRADKGSDATWKQALAEGAIPQAAERAQRFVDGCHDVEWICASGALGLPGLPTLDAPAKAVGDTEAKDTRDAAKALAAHGIDLLCFVGGDGTAADIADAIGTDTPSLGIPAGVKITSPVFAHDPDEASWLVSQLTPGFQTVARDVTDLDEEAYRAGRLDTVLHGSLAVPLSPAVQGSKVATVQDTPLEPLVEQVMRDWPKNATHIVGAGSVCKAVKANFWGEPTLLGVDAIKGDRIIANDLDRDGIDALEDDEIHVWLSIIGGQGMLFGRGTQVFSPETLAKVGWDRIHVVAPPEKLVGLRGLHVDSGDPEFDASAPAYIRVTSGWNETRMVKVFHGPPSP